MSICLIATRTYTTFIPSNVLMHRVSVYPHLAHLVEQLFTMFTFIPFPFAIDDHQTANAKWMVDAGAAVLMQQKDMTVESLVKIIKDLENSRDKLTLMSKKAADMGIHDAAGRVASFCLEYAK